MSHPPPRTDSLSPLVSPHSSGDRALASGARCEGSNPSGGTLTCFSALAGSCRCVHFLSVRPRVLSVRPRVGRHGRRQRRSSCTPCPRDASSSAALGLLASSWPRVGLELAGWRWPRLSPRRLLCPTLGLLECRPRPRPARRGQPGHRKPHITACRTCVQPMIAKTLFFAKT